MSTFCRALLSVLAVVFAVSIAVGCRSVHISADKKSAQHVAAAWLGESDGPPEVSCRGHVCEIGIRQPFVDAPEAWLLAVPITTYYRDDFAGVKRIALRITDKHRGRVATFLCSLPKAPATMTEATNARDAHKMCKSSVAPTSDS